MALTTSLVVGVFSWAFKENSHHNGKTTGVKDQSEQCKDVAFCFEQILEAALYKTATVQPLNSHLINHPRRRRCAWY